LDMETDWVSPDWWVITLNLSILANGCPLVSLKYCGLPWYQSEPGILPIFAIPWGRRVVLFLIRAHNILITICAVSRLLWDLYFEPNNIFHVDLHRPGDLSLWVGISCRRFLLELADRYLTIAKCCFSKIDNVLSILGLARFQNTRSRMQLEIETPNNCCSKSKDEDYAYSWTPTRPNLDGNKKGFSWIELCGSCWACASGESRFNPAGDGNVVVKYYISIRTEPIADRIC
jgi:hypothetical protein